MSASLFLSHARTHDLTADPSFNMGDWFQCQSSGVVIKSVLNGPCKPRQTNIFDSHKCYLVAQQSFCLLLHACLLCLQCDMERPVVRTVCGSSVHQIVWSFRFPVTRILALRVLAVAKYSVLCLCSSVFVLSSSKTQEVRVDSDLKSSKRRG